MAEERDTVRRIAWRELFPWLLILRSFRLAISPPVLLLAALGTLLTPLGWGLAAELFGGPDELPPAVLALPARTSRCSPGGMSKMPAGPTSPSM